MSEYREFLEEYRQIETYLEQEFLEKDQEVMFRDIVELISRVGEHIFREEETIKERLGEIMGGKVLELESDKLIRQGMEQGIVKGMEQERQNTERERQKVKAAEEEIRRLKQLLAEKEKS